jgi:hypothetical protein
MFRVNVRDSQGSPIQVRSSPVLADVDGDGSLDITFGDHAGQLHCVDNTGAYLPGFPIRTGNLIENAPAVWDIDGDGLTEVAMESFDGKIYVWDTPWTFNPALAVWPVFKGNQRHTGVYGEAPFEITAVGEGDTHPARLLLSSFPNPFRSATLILYRIPEGTGTVPVDLRIFDLEGRLVRTLVAGPQPPGGHEIRWDGMDDAGRPVASGIYPYRLRAGEDALARKLILIR